MNNQSSSAVSATVLVHNSERTIKARLESLLGLVDDLVVIDDHSTDQTVKKVREVFPEANILTRSLDNDFAAQRNFSLKHCRHDWVICIDSDEVLSPELKESIQKTVHSDTNRKAFNCLRMNENIAGWSPEVLDRPILMKKNFLGIVKFMKRLVNLSVQLKESYIIMPGQVWMALLMS